MDTLKDSVCSYEKKILAVYALRDLNSLEYYFQIHKNLYYTVDRAASIENGFINIDTY